MWFGSGLSLFLLLALNLLCLNISLFWEQVLQQNQHCAGVLELRGACRRVCSSNKPFLPNEEVQEQTELCARIRGWVCPQGDAHSVAFPLECPVLD